MKSSIRNTCESWLRLFLLQISYRIGYRILRPYLNKIRQLNIQKVRFEVENSFDSETQIGKITLRKLLNKDDAKVIEIGANIGTDTLEFALMFPLGEIHAFEPLPLHLNKLVENVIGYNHVRIIPVALSNKKGFTKFYQSSGYSGGSGSIFRPTLHLIRDTETFFRAEDECIVPTLTLDDYTSAAKLGEIDFVWIDAQGAELRILEGAVSTLTKVKFIYAEVSTVPYYEGACTEIEVVEFLERHGFRIRKHFRPSSEECGNILWERAR